jgi:DNA-binding CsgD family transcriptional regulator
VGRGRGHLTRGNRRLASKPKPAELPFAASDLIALGLTPRQAEILSWLTVGKTDGEIAKILAISPRTVSHTLARIYRKLDVDNRVAAVAHAIRRTGHSR